MKYMQTVQEGAGAFGLPPRGDTADGGSETHTLRQEVGSQPREKRAIPVIRYSRGCRIIPPQPVPRERRKTDQIFDLSIAYHSPPGESSPNLEFSMNSM